MTRCIIFWNRHNAVCLFRQWWVVFPIYMYIVLYWHFVSVILCHVALISIAVNTPANSFMVIECAQKAKYSFPLAEENQKSNRGIVYRWWGGGGADNINNYGKCICSNQNQIDPMPGKPCHVEILRDFNPNTAGWNKLISHVFPLTLLESGVDSSHVTGFFREFF
jgi:hypothetical protein